MYYDSLCCTVKDWARTKIKFKKMFWAEALMVEISKNIKLLISDPW